jgi:hypothetical protein
LSEREPEHLLAQAFSPRAIASGNGSATTVAAWSERTLKEKLLGNMKAGRSQFATLHGILNQ